MKQLGQSPTYSMGSSVCYFTLMPLRLVSSYPRLHCIVFRCSLLYTLSWHHRRRHYRSTAVFMNYLGLSLFQFNLTFCDHEPNRLIE